VERREGNMIAIGRAVCGMTVHGSTRTHSRLLWTKREETKSNWSNDSRERQIGYRSRE
jgi:hypothetical protein